MDELAGCIPLQSPLTENQANILQDDVADNDDMSSVDTACFDKLDHRKSVTFEEDGNRDTSLISIPQVMPPTNKRNNIPQALRPLAQVRLNTPAKDYAKVKFLSICPREELTLNHVSGENDVADIMVLKNKSVKDIAYKIKVTSPEKFRIRPSTGIIPSGGTEFIRIYLQNEFRNLAPREKLLLMAVEISGKSCENFGNVWKHSDQEAKIEHKLRCRLSTGNGVALATATLTNTNIKRSDDNLPVNREAVVETLETRLLYRQNIIMLSMAFIIALQLLTLIWQHRYFTSALNIPKDFCSKCESHSNNLFFDSEL